MSKRNERIKKALARGATVTTLSGSGFKEMTLDGWATRVANGGPLLVEKSARQEAKIKLFGHDEQSLNGAARLVYTKRGK